MRTTYVAIVYVTKDLVKKVKETIKEKFEDPEIFPISSVEEFERLHVKAKSNETLDSFKNRLNEIEGVGKSTIVEESFKIPKTPKWILWGILSALVLALVFLTLFSFFPHSLEDADSRFEVFTNTETLFIEILFAISITLWLIFREKKWQRNVSDALIEIQILTSEIKQYVKSIEKKKD